MGKNVKINGNKIEKDRKIKKKWEKMRKNEQKIRKSIINLEKWE